jgi:hypothetical protein
MEAICSSETLVDTQLTTRRHIPDDDTAHRFSIFGTPCLVRVHLHSIGIANEVCCIHLIENVSVAVGPEGLPVTQEKPATVISLGVAQSIS